MDYALLPRKMRESTEIAILRTSNGIFGEAADVLAHLAPQEILARRLAEVGALVDFPAYTPDLSGLAPEVGAIAKLRVLEVHPDECRVAYRAVRVEAKVWMLRKDLIGIAKPARLHVPER